MMMKMWLMMVMMMLWLYRGRSEGSKAEGGDSAGTVVVDTGVCLSQHSARRRPRSVRLIRLSVYLSALVDN